MLKYRYILGISSVVYPGWTNALIFTYILWGCWCA